MTDNVNFEASVEFSELGKSTYSISSSERSETRSKRTAAFESQLRGSS